MTQLLPIVEGDGDKEAVPLLIRRVLGELHNRHDVTLLPSQVRREWPIVKRNFERYYLSALIEQAPILWVMDFDCDDCRDVAHEAAWAAEMARRLDPRGRVEIAFLVLEFESLFLWDIRPLKRRFAEMLDDAQLPANPETVRNAKGWISSMLPKGRAYKPTVDQAKIVATLDLTLLRSKSPSFRRFEDLLLKLV